MFREQNLPKLMPLLPLGTGQMTSFASVSSLAQPMSQLPVLDNRPGHPPYQRPGAASHPAGMGSPTSTHYVQSTYIHNGASIYSHPSPENGSLSSNSSSGSGGVSDNVVSPLRDVETTSTSSRSSEDSQPSTSKQSTEQQPSKERKRKG